MVTEVGSTFENEEGGLDWIAMRCDTFTDEQMKKQLSWWYENGKSSGPQS